MTNPFTTLVDVATLSSHLGAPDWVVVDLRHDLGDIDAGRNAYDTSHIPGAFFLHLDKDLSGPKTGRNGRHPLPDRQAFAALLGRHGISPSTQVVAYDAQGGMYAARLWWMLRWAGHLAVAVLDGGLQAWANAGLALESTVPGSRAIGPYPLGESLVPQVDADTVLANLRNGSRLIVDARGADRFRGENETLDPVGGHIPGAVNRPFRDNLSGDGRFKAAEILHSEFGAILADTPPHRVVAQCGSGVTACHNLLALEIAAMPGAALYPGSWSEWCADASRPIERG